MSLLLETIKVKNNKLQNIQLHSERANYSRRILLKSKTQLDFANLITIHDLDHEKTYMCRVLFSESIEKVEFLEYTPRIIKKLFLVTANDFDYSFKYADREKLTKLRNTIATEPDTDILIVKHGLITDTSFSNIAFFNGQDWFTPSTPLLKGTKRAYYIKNQFIKELSIKESDLVTFSKARLINAMIDLEDGTDIVEILRGG